MNIKGWIITVAILGIIIGIMMILLSSNRIADVEIRVLNTESKIDAILKRMSLQDKAIEELGKRIDGGVDSITSIQRNYDNLKKNAERTHMIALEALNEMEKYSVHGKHVKQEEKKA